MNLQAYRRPVGVAILTLVLVALGIGVGVVLRTQRRSPTTPSSSPMAKASATPPQPASVAEEAVLLSSFIGAGSLADLGRPNFIDYRDQVKSFYLPAGYALVWVQGTQPTRQAVAMSHVLLQAGSKGLNPDDYDGPRWADRIARLLKPSPPPSDADLARFDLAMTVCTMRYVSNLHIGRVNPKTLNLGLDVDGRKYDLSVFLRERLVNADSESFNAALARVEPPFDAYRRLATALLAYEAFASEDSREQLPVPPKTVNPGDTYAGVPRLANLLRLVGDLPTDATVSTDPPVYQMPLVDAVKKFQGRHGLDPDGRLGAQTVKQLNVPLSQRVEQIELAMERWRWVPHHFMNSPIIVNIPEFILRCWDESNHNVLQMRVVVGKAYHHKTPVFSDDMRYIIFRPYWDVPISIVRAETVPKTRRDPDYLTRNNFEVTTSDGTVVTEGAMRGDILRRIASGELSVRQKPGPKNALGLIKFIFPNDYNVYLHSTDQPQLFARSQRDFSHGCIRLQDPVGLAAWVLRDQPPWDRRHIAAAMNGGADDQRVNLNKPIPVLIIYTTAGVRPAGDVQFFDDIYGYDTELERALANAYTQ